MANECRRHNLPTDPDPNQPWRWYTKRCAHFGNRFVDETRRSGGDGVFIDYVENLPDGGVIVEGHYGLSLETIWEGEPPVRTDQYKWVDISDKMWEELVARMLADDPPRPEWGG